MLLNVAQTKCSVEKHVTIRTTKILENCIGVVHVAYVVVVYQQSHISFIFMHTLSSKYSDYFSIHNIYIPCRGMLRVSRSSTVGISFIWTPSN